MDTSFAAETYVTIRAIPEFYTRQINREIRSFLEYFVKSVNKIGNRGMKC
jgi:hypothetical protein